MRVEYEYQGKRFATKKEAVEYVKKLKMTPAQKFKAAWDIADKPPEYLDEELFKI